MNLKTLMLMSLMVLSSTSVLKAELVAQIPGPVFLPTTYLGQQSALSQFDANGPSSLPPFRTNFATIYDNFTFASSGVINSLSWIGQYEDGSTLPLGGPNFQVNFYTSLGPTVGSAVPVATYNIGTASEVNTGVNGTASNVTPFYRYTTTSTPFNVVGGTPYFVSIVSQLDYSLAGWGVAFSTLGDGVSTQDFEVTTPELIKVFTRFNDTVDYAININVSAVPEPGSVAAIFAVAGLVAVRRRRVAK